MKVRLQNKEALLLELFLKNKTKIVTKEMIVEKLYGIESYSEGTIKNIISQLRKN
jgi:DNA-binding response OmpR family regulator